jgi:hypothetical protein
MKRDIKRIGLAAAVCGLALLAVMPLGRGEVTRTSEPTPRQAPDEITLVPANDSALRAQCWQEGVKIIDQTGLAGLALSETIKQQTVTFRGASGEQPRTLILPFPDGMCLIQPES